MFHGSHDALRQNGLMNRRCPHPGQISITLQPCLLDAASRSSDRLRLEELRSRISLRALVARKWEQAPTLHAVPRARNGAAGIRRVIYAATCIGI